MPPSLTIRNVATLDARSVTLIVRDGYLAASGATDRDLDGDGLTALPGFIDLQVNGAAGADLTRDPEALWEVGATLPRYGVTCFLPTLVTTSPRTTDRALEVLLAGPPRGWVGASPHGWHLEGPMISRDHPGAHAVGHIVAPSPELISGWSAATGVAMVTLAPELPGASTVMEALAGAGVVVSLGHTAATAADARGATDAGARMVTHLFNAMATPHHRSPGLAGAVLSGLPLAASLIADGHHVGAEMFRVAWNALGPGRRVLVSDASAALGAPAGRYTLGDVPIVSDGFAPRVAATGALAGTARGLDAMLRGACEMTGSALRDAAAAVTRVPAELLGRPLPELGVGSRADLVLLDADGQVALTLVGGAVAFERESA